MARCKLGDMLLDAGMISEFELNVALSDQRQWQRPLGITLVRFGFVSEAELTRVLSKQLGVAVVDLLDKVARPEALDLVPHEISTKHSCLPLAVRYEGSSRDLYVAMSDPTDLEAVAAIGFRAGHQIRPVLVAHEQLEAAIERSYGPDASARFPQITFEEILEPEGPAHGARRADCVQQPPKPAQIPPEDEPQLELTERANESGVPPWNERHPTVNAISTRSPEAQADLVQALVRLMISKGLIDPDELLRMIQSIAGERTE